MKNVLSTRYPGLSSFTTAQKDIFFGRKQETRELFNLIAVERTVVLFSKSGYGKTSLLQAGVIPLLYGQMMIPVFIRFGTDALAPEQHFSIQLDTAWHRFQGKTESEAQKQARDTSAIETFWAQISRCPFNAVPARFTPLFIFDQFEELFTLYPDRERRQRFIHELADLIHENMPNSLRDRILTELDAGKITDEEVTHLEKAPPMRFVFSIRSDMLHFVDELSEQIPYILRSRYQLFGLNIEQAIDAIITPAALTGKDFASPPFVYSPLALQQILEVLSKNREVESFQLQAVCQAIEEKIIVSPANSDEGKHIVTPDFYGDRAGIDDILGESYNHRIAGLEEKGSNWPLAARQLLEDVLVNQNDRRKSVDIEDIPSGLGVSAALLDELERQRLLRKEPRLDSFYYEISHDTWLPAILKSRRGRQEAAKKAEDDRFTQTVLILIFVSVLALAGASSIFYLKDQAEANSQQNYQSNTKLIERVISLEIIIKSDSFNYEDYGLEYIPSKIEMLQDVRKINLGNNKINKLPPEIGNLENLYSLHLNNNELNSLPAEIRKLQNLQLLDLSHNKLSELPTEITNLQNLRALDLSENYLKSLSDKIGELQKLDTLNLGDNNLTNLPYDALKQMRNLKLLQLENRKNLTSGNQFKNEDIDDLEKSMPWCQIIWRKTK